MKFLSRNPLWVYKKKKEYSLYHIFFVFLYIYNEINVLWETVFQRGVGWTDNKGRKRQRGNKKRTISSNKILFPLTHSRTLTVLLSVGIFRKKVKTIRRIVCVCFLSWERGRERCGEKGRREKFASKIKIPLRKRSHGLMSSEWYPFTWGFSVERWYCLVKVKNTIVK